jgi:hypothetical protein
VHNNLRNSALCISLTISSETAAHPRSKLRGIAFQNKYSADQIMGTDFDPDLIMLYFFPASWTKKGIGTKQNDVLSRMEKELVAGALMYPKGGTEATGAVKLTVNAKPRTKGSIGKFGE